MTWIDRIIPGFLGKAMRDHETKLAESSNSNVDSLHSLYGPGDNDYGRKKTIIDMDTNIPQNEEVNHSNLGIRPDEAILNTPPPHFDNISIFKNKLIEIMSEPKIQAKVISGKNGQELENAINQFLSLNQNIEVIDSNFATQTGGVYYTLLYKVKVERV
jgi:hypothetical protein